ncbi:hypothetical protein [Microbacterium arborescens]|uniref:hypothetical protein n=1 Tax=Microbacterium arborescens TaxID=33883 RepID=UPI000DF753B3|nr:hypothetical protein [Microbacterium arborescens]
MSFEIHFDGQTQPMASVLRDVYFRALDAATTPQEQLGAALRGLEQAIVAIGILELQINTDMPRPEYDPTGQFGSGRMDIPSAEIPDEFRNPLSLRVRQLEDRLRAAGL